MNRYFLFTHTVNIKITKIKSNLALSDFSYLFYLPFSFISCNFSSLNKHYLNIYDVDIFKCFLRRHTIKK